MALRCYKHVNPTGLWSAWLYGATNMSTLRASDRPCFTVLQICQPCSFWFCPKWRMAPTFGYHPMNPIRWLAESKPKVYLWLS